MQHITPSSHPYFIGLRLVIVSRGRAWGLGPLKSLPSSKVFSKKKPKKKT